LYLFFTAGNYDNLFFTGPGELLGFIVQGGNLKGCTLIFYFFIAERERSGGMEFFYGPFIGNVKGGGGKGLTGFSENVFFIVERVGGYSFVQIDYGRGVG